MSVLSKRERFEIRYSVAKQGNLNLSTRPVDIRLSEAASGVYFELIGWYVDKQRKERKRQAKQKEIKMLIDQIQWNQAKKRRK